MSRIKNHPSKVCTEISVKISHKRALKDYDRRHGQHGLRCINEVELMIRVVARTCIKQKIKSTSAYVNLIKSFTNANSSPPVGRK